MRSPDSPPRAAERLLGFFVKGALHEEILGDLHEYYEEELVDLPHWKRRLLYWFHVLHFLRPFALKKLQTFQPNTTTMLRHSLLISLRNFKRYPGSFLINTIGLSSALACVVLIYLWVDDELSIDKFHEHGDQLYHVMANMDFPRGMQTTPNTSGLLGPLMEEELPEIDRTVQVAKFMEGATLSHEEGVVKADGHFVTGDFFNVFSFQLIHGDRNNLWANPNGVLVSRSLANKLFPSETAALGEVITYQNKTSYAVSGIFEDVPAQSSERFDFLLSYEQTATGENDHLLDWGSQSTELYITLQPGTDLDAFNEKIKGFIGKHSERSAYRLPFATKYEEKYLQGTYENGEQVGGRIEYVRFFSLIAVFIMGIACINFMNLATARASRRFKEIGIKKVAGAKRGTLARQYLLEAVLVALVSLALALIMVLLVLPIFNQITGKQLHLQLSLEFMSLLIGLAVGTGILSGSYPALYLSGFKPIAILKGRLNASTGELWTRRGLVVIQYAIAAVLIVLVTVIYQQMDFIQSKNLGYNKDHVLHFYIEGKLDDVPQLESFLTEVKRLSGVQRASAARVAMTGDTWGVGGIRWPGSTPEDYTYFQHVIAYHDLFETLDIEMAAGRAYSSAFTNEDKKVIFNEAAIAFMGLEDPLGQKITFWGQEKEIIGVVKDFHFASFHEKIAPMIINYWPDRLSSIIVKIESGQESGVLSEIESLYEAHNPGFLFDAKFLDSNFQELYASEKRVSTLSTHFAGIAILIACLGLFGLAAFTAERRVKEIGIRKVMGASLFNIVSMLSTGFAKLVMTAVVLALPISYFLAVEWLQSFSYRIDLVWWYFAGSGLLVLLIAVLTVGGQTVRAALQNPVKNLRSE